MTSASHARMLVDLIAKYDGKPVEVSFRELVPEVSRRDRLTHLSHAYPAKVIPHIPSFFLSALGAGRRTRVLDPFCGSGTVLLEALCRGAFAFGADINPLARLISKVKTTPLDPARVRRSLHGVIRNANSRPRGAEQVKASLLRNFPNAEYWFEPHILTGIANVRAAIDCVRTPDTRDFLLVALSTTARNLSNADPRVSVPVRQKPERLPKHHWLQEKASTRLANIQSCNPVDVFAETATANILRMSELRCAVPPGMERKVTLLNDARKLQRLEGGTRLRKDSIDLTITSPPYLGAQKYIRASSLNLMWMGCRGYRELRKYAEGSVGREHLTKSDISSSVARKLPAHIERHLSDIAERNELRSAITREYLRDMQECLNEIFRVTKPHAHLVLVMGNNYVAGKPFPTDNLVERLATDAGFVPRLKLADMIPSRGLMTRRNRTAGTIPFEIVTLFQKDPSHG